MEIVKISRKTVVFRKSGHFSKIWPKSVEIAGNGRFPGFITREKAHYQGKKDKNTQETDIWSRKWARDFRKKKKVVNYPITWASIGPDSEPPKFWPPDFPWAFRRQTPPLVVYRGTSRDPGKSGKSGKTAVFRKSGHFFNFRVISSDFRVIFEWFIAWFIAIYSVFWGVKTRLKSLCASLIIFGKTSPLEMLFRVVVDLSFAIYVHKTIP